MPPRQLGPTMHSTPLPLTLLPCPCDARHWTGEVCSVWPHVCAGTCCTSGRDLAPHLRRDCGKAHDIQDERRRPEYRNNPRGARARQGSSVLVRGSGGGRAQCCSMMHVLYPCVSCCMSYAWLGRGGVTTVTALRSRTSKTFRAPMRSKISPHCCTLSRASTTSASKSPPPPHTHKHTNTHI